MGNKHWTSNEINILQNFGLTNKAKDLLLILPNRSIESIRRKRIKLRMILTSENRSKILCSINSNLSFFDLDNNIQQILIGSMLGDGCITKNKNNINFFFSEGHGYQQEDYIIWKYKHLLPLKPRLNYNKRKIDIQTPSHPIFSNLRQLFYNKNSKLKTKSLLPLQLLNSLDLLGLLVWYLDDGNNSNGNFSICSGYDYNNLYNFITLFNKKFNLNIKITHGGYSKNLEYFILRIPSKDRDKILPIWLDLAKKLELPKCMYYKFETYYNKDTLYEI